MKYYNFKTLKTVLQFAILLQNMSIYNTGGDGGQKKKLDLLGSAHSHHLDEVNPS